MFLLSQVLKEGHLCLVLWSALKCSPIFFAVLWLNLTIFFPGSRSLCVLTSWIPAGISTCLEAAASFGCCSGPMDGEPWRTHGVVIDEGYGMILDTPLQWLRKYEKIHDISIQIGVILGVELL
jgi:hypothetical protein